MKKHSCLILVLLIIAGLLFTNVNVFASNAKTLRELRSELSSLKSKKANNESSKYKTKNEISSAKNSVSNKREEISNNQQKVIDATNESKRLETEIETGKEEIKQLMKTYQLSSGDNTYLEYIFTSSSYEDLIYRYAVMEMVMNYENKQIGKWQDKITYNTQLKSDLAEREKTLNKQIDSLATEIDSLGDKLDELDDMALDIDKEIKSTQNLINYYVKIGCKETENLDRCVSVRGDTKFRRPLVSGTITSNFGYRRHPVTGKVRSFHSGTDIGVREGSSVYAIANGTVGKIVNRSNCGGNMVYVYHTIDGRKYTSTYMHLLSINVKLGDIVTSNTVVGRSGGSSTRSYDRCTTGGHLHLSLATGWYGSTYVKHSSWKSHLVNPRNYVKLPRSWSFRD